MQYYCDNKFTLSDGQVLEVTAALQEAENFKGNLSISESFRNRIRPAMGNRAYKNSILQYKLPARANFSISDFAIQGNDIEARKNQAVRLLSSKINDLLYANKVLASGLVGSTEKAAASSNAKMLGGVIGGYLGDAAEYAYKTIQNDKINGVIQQGSNNAGVSAKDMQALSLRVASRLVECYQWLFTEIAADDVSFVLKKILPQISKSIRKGSLGNLSLTDKITYITNDVLSMHMSNQGFLGLTKRELRGHDNRDSDITIEGAVCYPTYVVVDVKNSKNEDFYSYTCYTRGNDPEPDNGYVLLTSAEFNTLKMHESGGAQMFRKLNEECYKENHTSKNLDNLDDNHILKQIENKMHGNNVHELIEDFARKKNKETKELKKIKILEPVNMEVNGSELDITLAAQRENMDSGIKLFALLPDQKTCDNVFEDDSQKKTTTNFSTPQKRNN